MIFNIDGWGTGRREQPDLRDFEHLVFGTALPEDPDAALSQGLIKPRKMPWRTQESVYQGNTGTCVGHAWRNWLNTAPYMHKADIGPDGFTIYRMCVPEDEWTENDHETTAPIDQLQFGSSIRAGAKAMVKLGYIKPADPKDPKSGYSWVFNNEKAIAAVKTVTPLVAGTLWSNSMFYPDNSGVIRYFGRRGDGGHAYLWMWWDDVRGAYLIQNTWRGWGIDHPLAAKHSFFRHLLGKGGFAYLPGEDAEKLLRYGGELCTALQVRKPKPRQAIQVPLPI